MSIQDSRGKINVLVTGFGTFSKAPATNASWEIAQRLVKTFASSPHIRIVLRPNPVPVVYHEVDKLIPQLYEGDNRPQVVLHMGVAGNRGFYAMEMLAHKTGYNNVDNCNQIPSDDTRPLYWESAPDVLHTNVPKEVVVKRWQSEAEDLDLRVSTDAGLYLCEYILFSSLAYLKDRERSHPEKKGYALASFLHVPSAFDEDSLEAGTRAAAGLITALVHEWQTKSSMATPLSAEDRI